MALLQLSDGTPLNGATVGEGFVATFAIARPDLDNCRIELKIGSVVKKFGEGITVSLRGSVLRGEVAISLRDANANAPKEQEAGTHRYELRFFGSGSEAPETLEAGEITVRRTARLAKGTLTTVENVGNSDRHE